MVAAQMRMMQ
jgi:hypothetical protein